MDVNKTNAGLPPSALLKQGVAPSESVTQGTEAAAASGNLGGNPIVPNAGSAIGGPSTSARDALGLPEPSKNGTAASTSQFLKGLEMLEEVMKGVSMQDLINGTSGGATAKQGATGSAQASLSPVTGSFSQGPMASMLDINTLFVQVQTQNRKQNRDDMKAAMDGIQKTTEATVTKMKEAADARFAGQIAGAIIGAMGGAIQTKIAAGGSAGNAGMAQATQAQGAGQIFSSISQMANAIGENTASAADREVKILDASSQRLEKQYQEANSAADAAATAIQAGRDTVRALLDASTAKNVAQNI